MEEVIYKHETNGEFTGIYAQIEDGKLTITEQDMGEFEKEYSRDGEVESFIVYYFFLLSLHRNSTSGCGCLLYTSPSPRD